MAKDPARSTSRIVDLTSTALRDQSVIYAYTAEQHSTGQAERYLDFLDKIMDELADNPAGWPLVENLTNVRSRTARWKNAKNGHRIFYRETENGILVLRILHGSRNWPDHLGME